MAPMLNRTARARKGGCPWGRRCCGSDWGRRNADRKRRATKRAERNEWRAKVRLEVKMERTYCANCAQEIEPDDGGAIWYHAESASAYCDGDDERSRSWGEMADGTAEPI